MNAGLEALQPYPFEKLARLFEDISLNNSVIPLTIGEPQHPPPETVLSLQEHAGFTASYPATAGREHSVRRLRSGSATILTICSRSEASTATEWHQGRFVCPRTSRSDLRQSCAVISPNPFYQIYEGAALLAGTKPLWINCNEATGFLPDFDLVTSEQWQACELLYICTPGNPAGAVMPREMLQKLIHLADEHDFLIASDECYSEIYPNENIPPPGLLQAAAELGHHDYRRCLCFHSLSKRSNLPGLRSGFVAGDAAWIDHFKRYRTYHGCAMPLHHQIASEWAWGDEEHVAQNRVRYREKFAAVIPILAKVMAIPSPEAGFYLWPQTPIDDEVFARQLLERAAVKVLPGRYLARNTRQGNPGENRVRLALVAELENCVEAAERIAHAVKQGW